MPEAKFDFTRADEHATEFFSSYQLMGGTDDREEFGRKCCVFFGLTWDAYVGGEGSRHVAFKKWVEYLEGDRDLAFLYFNAIDNVHPYT